MRIRRTRRAASRRPAGLRRQAATPAHIGTSTRTAIALAVTVVLLPLLVFVDPPAAANHRTPDHGAADRHHSAAMHVARSCSRGHLPRPQARPALQHCNLGTHSGHARVQQRAAPSAADD